MRIILKEYLASLKERDELDKLVLPNLLSSMGMKVIETPMKGVRQYGVDLAAVGQLGEDNIPHLYLFCVKAGDVDRNVWDGGIQSVRSELDEILDVYLPNHVASEHKKLPVKICLCCGGELAQNVNQNWSGFTNKHENEYLKFELWNGETLAAYMEKTLLARELLSGTARSKFQKALAMVNEPESCYQYTFELLNHVLPSNVENYKDRLFNLRQAFICLHAICAWAIEEKSLDAVYRISELGLLFCWDVIRELVAGTNPTKEHEKFDAIWNQYLTLYILNFEFYFRKVNPYVDRLHILSISVKSKEPVDVNLALFELLGRMAIKGIWTNFLGNINKDQNPELSKKFHTDTTKMLDNICDLIINNPTLNSPFKDDQMIEIALVMYLACQTNSVKRFQPWIYNLAENITIALVNNSKYPICNSDYIDLLAHPLNKDNEHYREQACAGSILYPYLFYWLPCCFTKDEIDIFLKTLEEKIPNCTHQVWFPNEETDQKIWRGETYHGIALPELSPSLGYEEFMAKLNEATKHCRAIDNISAVKRKIIPLFFSACRHYRMPITPSLWV